MKIAYSTLRESVFATLAFFDLFDHPLTLVELHHFMMGFRADEDELREYLKDEKGVQFRDGFYFLVGREAILAIHQQRTVWAEKFWRRVRRFGPLMQMVPFVEMIAVCNTLAFGNPTAESDIDLFIIVKKGRLFLARTLMTLWLGLLGVRRHGSKIAGRFCLSFYVTDDALDLEKIQLANGDIYLAYWMRTLKPVFGRAKYEEFLKQNSWIADYFSEKNVGSRDDGQDFGNVFQQNLGFLQKDSWLRVFALLQAFFLRGKFGDWLEKKLFQMQQKRHARRVDQLGLQASVVVSSTMLKFHNVDRRDEFARKFQERFKEVL